MDWKTVLGGGEGGDQGTKLPGRVNNVLGTVYWELKFLSLF